MLLVGLCMRRRHGERRPSEREGGRGGGGGKGRWDTREREREGEREMKIGFMAVRLQRRTLMLSGERGRGGERERERERERGESQGRVEERDRNVTKKRARPFLSACRAAAAALAARAPEVKVRRTQETSVWHRLRWLRKGATRGEKATRRRKSRRPSTHRQTLLSLPPALPRSSAAKDAFHGSDRGLARVRGQQAHYSALCLTLTGRTDTTRCCVFASHF